VSMYLLTGKLIPKSRDSMHIAK